MKYRVVLGIFLPLAVAVAFLLLSAAHPGLSVEKETVASVDASSLVRENSNVGVRVQTITVRNEYFLPFKYELPSYVACAVGSEGARKGFDASMNRGERPHRNMFEKDSRAVDVSAGGKEDVQVFVQPEYLWNSTGYDALVLVESRAHHRYACEEADLDGGVRIPFR